MPAHASISQRVALWAAQNRGAPKLAAAYAAAGLAALATAPALGALGWLPSWAGIASLVLAYAYAVNRPAVFGKRSDGSLSPWSVLVLLPYLSVAWGFFALKVAGLRREPCWHRVAPGLYLGRRPCACALPPDCALIVDLTAEFPAPAKLVAARKYLCLPTLNRHAPADGDLRALLRELREFRDGAIYVHCGAGRGRSALVVAALLVTRGEARDARDAEAKLARLRPGVRLHPAQRAIIDRCCLRPRLAAARSSPV